MSRVDYGQVEIDLGGEVVTLKPTLSAMQRIDRHFGSIREAINQVGQLSFDAVAFVITAGAGLSGKDARDLPEQVFAAGVMRVAGKAAEYLALLLNPTGKQSVGDPEGKD